MAELPVLPADDISRRRRLARCAEAHVAERSLVPPLTLEELQGLADQVLAQAGESSDLRDAATVFVSNAVWRPVVESIPFSRRVLLLPQCLRDRSTCPARLDAVGLLCEECGGCSTGVLQATAESLGYVVLVAEGTTVVTTLLATGQVDCVIGVSCLSTLERSFPHTIASAVPSLAVPLIGDGCDRTVVDAEMVLELLRAECDTPAPVRMDIDAVRDEVASWFAHEPIRELLDIEASHSEDVAVSWMANGGKRWRPFLATAVHRIISGGKDDSVIRPLAVAVECFHKASLAHDDIEDGDDERYGLPTLHRRHGLPVALNAGDLLIGEGYRLISECNSTAERLQLMLRIAALGHRELCVGQGAELAWTHAPTDLGTDQVLQIFRQKTAPAFRVALCLGAVGAGADSSMCSVLEGLSDALGIAYQIRDDIEDFSGSEGDVASLRPSLLVTLALSHMAFPLRQKVFEGQGTDFRKIFTRINKEGELDQRAWTLYTQYRQQALRSLEPLEHGPLKSFLFRIVHKVLPAPPMMSKPLESRNTQAHRRPFSAPLRPGRDNDVPGLGHVV